MKLVYNPGNTPITYGDGLYVEPESWAYADDVDTRLDEEINAGRLVQLDVPERLPEHVNPRALPALSEAIEDRKKSQDEEKNSEKAEVRNTDSSNSRGSNRKTQNKEA